MDCCTLITCKVSLVSYRLLWIPTSTSLYINKTEPKKTKQNKIQAVESKSVKAVGKIFLGTENIVGYAWESEAYKSYQFSLYMAFQRLRRETSGYFQDPNTQRMLSQEDDGHTYVLKEASKQLPERSQCLPQRGIHNLQEEEIGNVRALGIRQVHILLFGF